VVNPNAEIDISQVTGAAAALGGFYNPLTDITIVEGASSAVFNSGLWQANSENAGGMYMATVEFTVTSDGTGDLIKLSIPGPLEENFTDPYQAKSTGFPIIRLASLDAPGAIGSGSLHSLYANDGGNGVLVTLEAAEINKEYTVTLSWLAQLQ
jgi:hypothetical protein